MQINMLHEHLSQHFSWWRLLVFAPVFAFQPLGGSIVFFIFTLLLSTVHFINFFLYSLCCMNPLLTMRNLF